MAAALLYPCVDLPPAQFDPLRFQQPELPISSNGKCVHVEIGLLAIRRTHYRGRRGHDLEPAALPDPVDMPMAVHDRGVIGKVLQTTNEPAAIDECRPDTLGQFLRRLRIFDDEI